MLRVATDGVFEFLCQAMIYVSDHRINRGTISHRHPFHVQ